MPWIQASASLGRQAVGMVGQHVFQALAGDVLHDHPGVALVVLADVVEVQQVGVFQVEALADAAELDVQVAADQLQGDFLAGVAGGVVDFAEAALADAALDGVAGQRARAAGIDEPAAGAARAAGRPARRPLRARRLTVRFHGSHLLLHRSTLPLYLSR